MPTALGTATGSVGGLTNTIALTTGVVVGNGAVIVSTITGTTTTVSSITQVFCTWTKAASVTGNGLSVEVWYCTSAGSTPGGVATITYSANATGSATYERYDTALAATPVDQTGTSGSAGTTLSSTTAGGATAQASELWIIGLGVSDPTNIGFTLSSPTGGFTIAAQIDAGSTAAVLNGLLRQIASSTGTPSGGATWGSSLAYEAALVTFKFLVAGGGGTSIFLPLVGVG